MATANSGAGSNSVSPVKRRRRGLHVSTLATLLFGLPWLAASLLVVGFVASALSAGDQTVIAVVAGVFVGSGVVTFLRPTEALLARLIFRVRRPTAEEQERLDACWYAVTAAAGQKPAKYSLWVQDVNSINAFATAGHTVGVTRWALWNLAPYQLEGVLAHELGHHIGGHSWARLLMYWYSLPGRLVVRLSYLCMVVATMMIGLVWAAFGRMQYVRRPGLLQLLLVLGALGVLAYQVHPALLTLFAVPFVAAWFRRRDEKYADRVAADLGYGDALIEVIEIWVATGQGVPGTVRGVVFASHPSHASRVKALEKRVYGSQRRRSAEA